MLPPTALPPATAPATQAPRIDAYQAGGQGTQTSFGQSFNNAIDQFGVRSAEMQASLRQMGQGAPAAAPPTGSVTPPAEVGGTGKPGAIQNPMGLMVDSFNFAIQASLLSRAATQFTGSISTLMKGQ